ncbi:Tetratricopeptide repeat-containing protein [Alteromonadaceae bacterium Bs31]|nr:Tetratricopeptide repeat-containing protein [Alteromonadaceae bacterium Bs31]
MEFIKIYPKALIVFMTLLFVACGGGIKDDAGKHDDAQGGEQRSGGAESTEVADVPLELIPNPYLANTPSVSRKAKEEFASATVAMDAKQWKQAEGLLRLMTETYPKLSGPYVNLGISLYQLQDLEGAEQSLQTAISVNGSNMDAYTWLGTLYREQGRFEDAEQAYLAALAVWPHHAESHRNLGILYDLYMGRFEEALQHYKMLQRLSPEEDRQVKGWIKDLERRLAQ